MYAETNANYFNNIQSFQFEVEGPQINIQHHLKMRAKSDTDTSIDSLSFKLPHKSMEKYEMHF